MSAASSPLIILLLLVPIMILAQQHLIHSHVTKREVLWTSVERWSEMLSRVALASVTWPRRPSSVDGQQHVTQSDLDV